MNDFGDEGMAALCEAAGDVEGEGGALPRLERLQIVSSRAGHASMAALAIAIDNGGCMRGARRRQVDLDRRHVNAADYFGKLLGGGGGRHGERA